MESGFIVKTVEHRTGEKSPILFNRASGLPDALVNDWKFERRSVTHSHLTLRQELLAVAFFLDVASLRRWEVDARFASGEGLTSDMLAVLVEDSWRWHSDLDIKETVQRSVIDRTRKVRVDAIRRYCVWRLEQVRQRILGDTKAASHRRVNIIYNIQRHEKALRAVASDTAPRRGLDKNQIEHLNRIVDPRSALNPFQKRFRLRNFVIVQLLLAYGLRRGELLLLNTADVDYRMKHPRIAVRRQPDSKMDRRTDTAVKTKERQIAMSKGLSILIRTYIREDRAALPHATRTPFLFLGANGEPLGTDGFQNLFVTLRRCDSVLDQLSGHILRHTWADTMQEAIDHAVSEGAIVPNLAVLAFNYLGGWTQQSKMSEQYSQGYIEGAANNIFMEASTRNEDRLREITAKLSKEKF